jgi:hypothetical protein
MRVLLPVLAFLVAPAALSQTPPDKAPGPKIAIEAPDGNAFLPGYETLDENGQIEKRVVVPPEVLQNQKLLESLRNQGFTPVPGPPPCIADYSDIHAEQRASDARLRTMKGTVIPLQHQYEQELYYRDRMEKRTVEKCGALKRSEWDQRRGDMTKKACEAIEVECKPVKHW